MLRFKKFPALLLLIILSAITIGCGDSSSSSSTGSSNDAFSVSPGSLSFSAQIDALAPPAQIITVKANRSDTVKPDVGYTPTIIDMIIKNQIDIDTLELTVTVKEPRFLTVGTHQTTINIESSQLSRSINLSYTISDTPAGTPQVNYVSPYIVSPASVNPVIIRGSGFKRFDAGNLPTVTFDANTGSDIQVISDTEIRANAPVLAAGSYAVSVTGSGTVFTSTASLTVMSDQTFASTSIASTDEKTNLMFDPLRNAIYYVNTTNDTLVRHSYVSGTTWNSDSVGLANISSAAMSPDGNTIVVTDGSYFYEVNLIGATTLTLGVAVPAPGSVTNISSIASVNSGNIIAVTSDGFSAVYTYDLQSKTTSELMRVNGNGDFVSHSIRRPRLVEVADGSLLYMGEIDSPGNLNVLSASDNSISETGIMTSSNAIPGVSSLAVSHDQSLLLVNGEDIYDNSFNSLGALPSGHHTAVLSPDGTITYGMNFLPSLFRSYDISNPATATLIGNYDLTGFSDPGYRPVLRINNEGSMLFALGLDNLLIINIATLQFQ